MRVFIYLLIQCLIVPLIATMEAKADVMKWHYYNQPIEHKHSSMYRFIGGLVACLLLEMFDIIYAAAIIPCLLSFGAMYWLMFDLSTNMFSGRKLLHIGSTSIIDSLFNNEKVMFVIKLFTIFTMTTTTILLLL